VSHLRWRSAPSPKSQLRQGAIGRLRTFPPFRAAKNETGFMTTGPVPAGTEGLLLPEEDEESRGFWEGTALGELRLQACGTCGVLRFPPRVMCPHCRSTVRRWEAVSGKGTIWSFVVAHPPLLPAYAALAPYPVITVTLDEGPALRMVGNLVGGPDGAINEIDPDRRTGAGGVPSAAASRRDRGQPARLGTGGVTPGSALRGSTGPILSGPRANGRGPAGLAHVLFRGCVYNMRIPPRSVIRPTPHSDPAPRTAIRPTPMDSTKATPPFTPENEVRLSSTRTKRPRAGPLGTFGPDLCPRKGLSASRKWWRTP
jgi:uncharacterized OB-fold protein